MQANITNFKRIGLVFVNTRASAPLAGMVQKLELGLWSRTTSGWPRTTGGKVSKGWTLDRQQPLQITIIRNTNDYPL